MQFGEQLEKYTYAAMHRRGHLINQIIVLERAIDYFIATHFCKLEESKKEFMEFIISGSHITLESKRQILMWILERHDYSFFKSNTALFSGIRKIAKHRNILAHYQLDTSVEAVEAFKETNITLIDYKKEIDKIVYSQQETQELVDALHDYILIVDALNRRH